MTVSLGRWLSLLLVCRGSWRGFPVKERAEITRAASFLQGGSLTGRTLIVV